MKLMITLTLLALGYQTASAQLVTESFGSGNNAFTMDFVTIGNPNNVADTTGSPNPAGSVAYIYNLAKYEVSRDMINKANTLGNLGITLSDTSWNGPNKPATGVGVSWYGVAKFVNWLNADQGYHAAYNFDGSGNFQVWSAGDAGYNASNVFRNSLAKYVIPSSPEWYKGAYGNLDGTWNNYPNGSDIAPTGVTGGTAANTAVWGHNYGPADITNAGSLSPYGTMAQGGNVEEWTETTFSGFLDDVELREIRGGYWSDARETLEASERVALQPEFGFDSTGFRVASVPEPLGVPEPSTGLLVVLGLSGLLLKRRRTGKV
jgi:formylglycine-generating enzyme